MKLILPFGLLAALTACATPLAATQFYVNQIRGSDANDGSQDQPFKTVARALKEVDGVGGEIDLSPEGGPYRESIFIQKGGRPDNPLILDGHGSVVNLGINVTQGPWTDTGNGFLLDRPVHVNARTWLATVAFVNGLPLFCQKPNHPDAWHGGMARYDDQGRLILVFPTGLSPANSVVVLTGGADGDMACGVHLVAASYVQIRNLTSVFSSNDGFNFHNGCRHVELQNVKGLFNGDQGTSAHEKCQVDVRDSEFAFDGSGDGAVEDAFDAITAYHNIRVHHNRGYAIMFSRVMAPGRHVLDNVVSFANGLQNLPQASDTVELDNCQDLGQLGGDRRIPVVADPNAPVDPSTPVDESDRLGRFLQVRPSADNAPGVDPTRPKGVKGLSE